MKPDWKAAPEEANYLAQDSDGEWYWYRKKPKCGSDGEWFNGGSTWPAGSSDAPIGPLEQRPQTGDAK